MTTKQLDKSFSLTRREEAQEFGAAPLPDHEKKTDPNTRRCKGCRGYHGGVVVERLCLEETVVALRQKVAELEEELAKGRADR